MFCKCEKIVCHTYMTYCVHEDHIAICLITFRIFISEHLIWWLSSICLLFRWGYRGVIIGWDEKARAPQEWSWVVLNLFSSSMKIETDQSQAQGKSKVHLTSSNPRNGWLRCIRTMIDGSTSLIMQYWLTLGIELLLRLPMSLRFVFYS